MLNEDGDRRVLQPTNTSRPRGGDRWGRHRWSRVLAGLAAALATGLCLWAGGVALSARVVAAANYPECNSVLHGPEGGTKTATVKSLNADGSVTLSVTVAFSSALSPKPGQHVFDCVFDGAASSGAVVGSTGTPGADCSTQGLPCTFEVTTQSLSSGTHRLCDIAKFEGFQSLQGPGDHSGDRTPQVCVSVTVPSVSPTPSPSPTASPVPSPSPAPSSSTPSPSPTATPGSGLGGATPGLPNTGRPAE